MKLRIAVICVIGLVVPVVFALMLFFVLPQDSFLVKVFLGDTKKAKKTRKALVRFQNMTPTQPGYRVFYNNYEKFYSSREGKEEERERLRDLRNRIESDPIAPALNVQLSSYYNWRKTIPQEQVKINEAQTIEQRLEAIREIKERQDRMQRMQDRMDGYWPNHAYDFGDSEDEDVYPTNAELAGFLESLEASQLQILLGREPKTFLYELQQSYHKAREYNRSQPF